MKTNKKENYDVLVELMEENPILFYDICELEGLGGHGVNDGVTQKTIQEWTEGYMKKDEE